MGFTKKNVQMEKTNYWLFSSIRVALQNLRAYHTFFLDVTVYHTSLFGMILACFLQKKRNFHLLFESRNFFEWLVD
jgi:hypothetical protein